MMKEHLLLFSYEINNKVIETITSRKVFILLLFQKFMLALYFC